MNELKEIPEINPQEEKLKNIKELILELESIEQPSISEEYTSDFSNDTQVAAIMPEIIESVGKEKALLRAVIMVGSGPLWNIPKELKDIDLVLSLDINRNQIQHNRQRRLEILSANKVEELLPKPKQEIDENDIYTVINERRKIEAPKIEQNSYLSYHYLSSEEKLHQTQDFLKKGNIAFVNGDLSNNDFTKILGNILNNHKISIVFSDFSNVMEWVAGSPGHISEKAKNNFLESLKNIPMTENCAILHSHSIGRVGRSPIVSQLSFGLIRYGQVVQNNLK
jgi:hypothetical protein